MSQLETQPQPLTGTEAAELLSRIKRACITATDSIQQAGQWLTEFRDREGWRPLEYKNWTACVEVEFKTIHGGRRTVFDLIQNAEVTKNIATLSAPLSILPAAPDFSAAAAPVLKLPIRQTQQLAKAPPARQSEALAIAKEIGRGTATAATVKQAVIQINTMKPVKIITRDLTGYAIPAKGLPMWGRREELNGIIGDLRKIRTKLKASLDNQDPIYARVNLQGILAKLKDASGSIGDAVPYAVCATCQGQLPESCKFCLGIGFVGKFHFDRAVPIELKAIRAKSCVPPEAGE